MYCLISGDEAKVYIAGVIFLGASMTKVKNIYKDVSYLVCVNTYRE